MRMSMIDVKDLKIYMSARVGSCMVNFGRLWRECHLSHGFYNIVYIIILGDMNYKDSLISTKV